MEPTDAAGHRRGQGVAGPPGTRPRDLDDLPARDRRVCGRPGSGRTTLLELLAGSCLPDAGEIERSGEWALDGGWSSWRHTPSCPRTGLLTPESVGGGQRGRGAPGARGGPEAAHAVRAARARSPRPRAVASRLAGDLAPGERQRLARRPRVVGGVAGAAPTVLLADEPTSQRRIGAPTTAQIVARALVDVAPRADTGRRHSRPPTPARSPHRGAGAPTAGWALAEKASSRGGRRCRPRYNKDRAVHAPQLPPPLPGMPPLPPGAPARGSVGRPVLAGARRRGRAVRRGRWRRARHAARRRRRSRAGPRAAARRSTSPPILVSDDPGSLTTAAIDVPAAVAAMEPSIVAVSADVDRGRGQRARRAAPASC